MFWEERKKEERRDRFGTGLGQVWRGEKREAGAVKGVSERGCVGREGKDGGGLLTRSETCEHHTSHVTFSRTITRTCVAQVVCLSCAHHLP